VNSCLVLAGEIAGRDVTTIEGLESWPGFAAMKQAFIEEDGLQCGYCTPGIVLAARALLDREPDPSAHRIRDWMAGNLCRCTGYETIVRAVQRAAERVRTSAPKEGVS
jgi:aerobic carbon-monoxide dehydrogenase small subunit